MANIKISNLPVAVSVAGSDSFPVVQSGVTKQATKSVLFASPTFTGTTAADIVTASGNVTFDGGTFVFNESGADKDARFEGDGDPNLLFLDASSDRIGIGTNSPQYKVDIAANANGVRGSRIRNNDSGSSASSVLQIGNDTNGAAAALILHSSTNTTALGGANALSLINGLAAPLVFATTNVERARLDASGNFGIGTATPTAKLQVSGGSIRLSDGQQIEWGGGFNSIEGSNASNYLRFWTNNAERMRIDASGNLGLGVNNPGYLIDATAPASGDTTFRLTKTGSINATINAVTGALTFGIDGSGGATERARITSVGDFIHQVNGTAPTLSTNSTMSFELTSNTSLKVVVRGTDGVTRSVSLTLA